jgi:hypothetical protein
LQNRDFLVSISPYARNTETKALNWLALISASAIFAALASVADKAIDPAMGSTENLYRIFWGAELGVSS